MQVFWLGCMCVGGCERQCSPCVCLWGNSYCNVKVFTTHTVLDRRVSHAPTGRFGNSVGKETNKGVYSPWEKEREREVLQKGKGRSFPWLSFHSDRQSQCVYEYLTECFFFFSLTCCQHYHWGSLQTGCFLISVILLDWTLWISGESCCSRHSAESTKG